jgi:zinc/manganese transport system permease protein
MLHILTYPFVWYAIACSLIIAGLHAYLGFHIVSRGVIFVDLALAQMAALGAVFGQIAGVPEGSVALFLVSLAFTFLGAWIVSISRMKDGRVPQEAFIGILYAGGAGATIMVLAHQSGGMEELQHLMAGSILTIAPREILTIALVYAGLGIFHYAFRGRFLLITEDRSAAVGRGWRVYGWDFVFYVTVAIMVTLSVHVAGVLLVFSLLVIPPVIALFYSRSLMRRLVLGWIIAVAGCIGGILLSIGRDLPAGPSIVGMLVVFLIVAAMIDRARGPRGEIPSGPAV